MAEDFGWWIEIISPLLVPTNIVLKRSHEGSGAADFAIAVDNSPRKWSWKRFKFVDLTSCQLTLASDLREILTSDADIEFAAGHLDS